MGNKPFCVLPSEVVAAAAEWFARLQDDQSREQDFIEWQHWMAAHPDHQRAYRDMEQAWRLIGEAPQPRTHGRPGGFEPRARRYRWFEPRAIAAAFVLLSLFGAAWFVVHAWMRMDATVATATAEQRSIRLEDGTRVMLGPESQLKHHIDAQRRRVALLQGEAYFQVAHDPSRPFVVSVANNEILAVGTAFNVLKGADRVVVTVAEGKVRVARANAPGNTQAPPAPASAAEPLLLVAGERAASNRSGIRKLAAIEAATAATWRVGRLEYLGEPLRHVLEDVARYTDRELVLADESLGELRYTGTIFTEHIDEWLEGVPGVLPIVVQDLNGRIEIQPPHL